jgi:cytochrome c oxidase subunit 2
VTKIWAILFGVVMALCGLLFLVPPLVPAPFWGWLPEGVSTHSWDVDFLFYVILYITGFFFFLTEGLLVAFMFLYCGSSGPKPARATGVPGLLKPVEGLVGDPHKVEMLWTIVPAGILLYIAFAQIGTWADVKYQKNMPEFGQKKDGKVYVPVQVDVSARQFEWRVRYPSHDRMMRWLKANKADKADFDSFAKVRQADDIDLVNEVHTWKDEPTVVYLTTRDVIHSFNIPLMRVKQDALPGKVIPVWFVPNKANFTWDDKTNSQVCVQKTEKGRDDPAMLWDIPCAELCGWGHYRMIGRIFVYPSQDEFLKWLKKADEEAHTKSGQR